MATDGSKTIIDPDKGGSDLTLVPKARRAALLRLAKP
jgi:hypothetical protein